MKKETKENWKNWKRFLDWVNHLSPWNLWSYQTWSKDDVEKRILNQNVESCLRDLLSQEKQKWLKKVDNIIENIKFRKVSGGYRQKDEPGTATNLEYCEGWNACLKEIKKRTKLKEK